MIGVIGRITPMIEQQSAKFQNLPQHHKSSFRNSPLQTYFHISER